MRYSATKSLELVSTLLLRSRCVIGTAEETGQDLGIRAKATGGLRAGKAGNHAGQHPQRDGRAAALVLIGGATLVLVAPSMASAQQADPYGGGSTVVVSPDDHRPGDDPGRREPTETSGSSLPFTGGDVAGLAAIGAGAVGIGVVASRARRRQSA